jgi:hypothetical protein
MFRLKLNKINVTKFKKFTWPLFIIIIAVTGNWLLKNIFASTTFTPVCGARKANYTYKVPFGNAPWNVPACNLPKFSQSADYVSRLWNYAKPNDGSPQAVADRGNFNVGFGLGDLKTTFSRAVYTKDEAEGKTIKIRVCGSSHCIPSNLDGDLSYGNPKGYLPDTAIPWNNKWTFAQGGDNEVVILDPSTGNLIALAQVKKSTGDPLGDILSGATGQCGPLYPERLCVASAKIIRNYQGDIASYFDYEGSTGDRGVGISYYATLLTPQEVVAGEIRHALGIGIFNASYGPKCTKEQLATNNYNTIGKTCGTAVAPAAKFEWETSTKISDRSGTPSATEFDSIITQDKTIPEGMRFVLNITDSEVEQFISSKGYTGAKANTTRIIIQALRDYGFIAVDTGGSAQIQVAGGVTTTNKNLWAQLGITQESDKNLLYGLFKESNLSVVDLPVNNCIDGSTSKFYCKYNSSKYTVTTDGKPALPPGSTTTNPPPTTEPTSCDFNNDTKVTITDLALLLSNYNKSVSQGTSGDCSKDGKVTITDLALLLSKYQKT